MCLCEVQSQGAALLYTRGLKLCRAHIYIPHALCSQFSIVLQRSTTVLFYDLTTLSNTELEHAQLL